MNIISYNVNGLRAAHGKGFIDWLQQESPDVICLQETKMQEGQFDTSIFDKASQYHHWHFAVKKGYSGVAIISKQKPDKVVAGIGIMRYDDEGRVLRADFGDLTVICVYIPSGSSGDERQAIKMYFLEDLLIYLTELRKTRPNLIVSGDYNICHKPIDINHPEKHNDVSGFLPEEREWMDRLISSGFVDSFRTFDSRPNQYSWWSYRAGARPKNLGWRIDYNMVTKPLFSKMSSASILSDIVHSDHCPVKLEIAI